MPQPLKEAPPPPPRLTPMEYLLRVMNDPTIDTGLRIEAAVALLPYMHRAITPLCSCCEGEKQPSRTMSTPRLLRRLNARRVLCALVRPFLLRKPIFDWNPDGGIGVVDLLPNLVRPRTGVYG